MVTRPHSQAWASKVAAVVSYSLVLGESPQRLRMVRPSRELIMWQIIRGFIGSRKVYVLPYVI
jgi:hypothetical protein